MSKIFKNPDTVRGLLYSVTGMIFLSGGLITAKYALSGFNPEMFSTVWCISAAVYAFIIVLATGRTRQIFQLNRTERANIILLGIFTGVGMILGCAGLARLDPSFAAFLWRFLPLLTILSGIIWLGERLMLKEILPIIIMIAGGAISTIGRWNIVGTGVILVLLACVTAAVQMIIGKTQSTSIHPTILIFYRSLISALLVTIWTITTDKVDFSPVKSYWIVTIAGAFLGPVAGFWLTFQSYRFWDLTRSSIVLTVQPIVVLPLAYMFLRQLPSKQGFIGGMIILAGALWLTYIHLARARKNKVEINKR